MEAAFTPVVLGLGSNLGDSRSILRGAIAALTDFLTEPRAASFYETSPLYVTDQPRFINTAVTGLYPGHQDITAARELLSRIQAIEARFGRD
ncbi:MAG: 2-amino-4-hydroxy-6-hydroxymethyldihydropteridine diphosphokinase, partial [Treponema sp.]|nr:2-amino-4-hydroxy-6-hydroxymethyldihydropteridine diphosphokinase [Treponema sp.]